MVRNRILFWEAIAAFLLPLCRLYAFDLLDTKLILQFWDPFPRFVILQVPANDDFVGVEGTGVAVFLHLCVEGEGVRSLSFILCEVSLWPICEVFVDRFVVGPCNCLEFRVLGKNLYIMNGQGMWLAATHGYDEGFIVKSCSPR